MGQTSTQEIGPTSPADATPRGLAAWRPDDRWVCLGAYLLLLVWSLPLLIGADRRGPPNLDWEWFLAYYQALRTTVVDFGQFPGLNPWMYLGSPLWGNPQIGPISHFTPLVLLAGPVLGMKLGIVASYFISFETARALGRELFRSPLAPAMAGLLYALNPALSAHWVLGQVCFSAYVWAPLLVLWCLRLARRPWAGAAAGASAGLMLQYGLHYYAVYVLLLGGLLALAVAARERALAALLRFGALFLLALLLVAGVRLLPMLAVSHDFPRQLSPPFSVDPRALWHMFLVPDLGPARVVLRIRSDQVVYQLTSLEITAYAGVVTLGLALYSLRWRPRFFHVGALLALLLLLGNHRPWELSRWLAELPPFDAMWVVTRWRLVVLACLGFAAAAAIDELLQGLPSSAPRWRRGLVALLGWAAPLELVAVLLPSFWTAVVPYRDRPVSRQELKLPQTPWLIAVDDLVQRSERARLYFSLFRSNIGAALGYDPLFGYRPAASARTFVGHPGYRGEAVVEGQAVAPELWSPNRLRFRGLPPGRTLELNMNPGRGWTLDGAPIFTDLRTFELGSRFRVTVPPSGVVDLRYTPPGLAGGLLLSLCGGLGLAAWAAADRVRRRRGRPA